ncbi:hypothetical protein QBC41DRAFT_219613 [Cercophora samala]|uniref:J domain-containing protein n=1 Tax=Cercophora samala TaxID=330535 RepID=A0AA39ZIE1_9PEZI|nr:hypothetical protein QBC41DRAFT_219613 [Cercophora samala]
MNTEDESLANQVLIQLQDAYNVLSDPDERSLYDGQVLQTYIQSLEKRKEDMMSCLSAKLELDAAREAQRLALEDFRNHLQLKLSSVSELITTSKDSSLGLSPRGFPTNTDRGFDKAKSMSQTAATKVQEAETRMNLAGQNLDRKTSQCNILNYELTGNSGTWKTGWDGDTANNGMALKMDLEQPKAEIAVLSLKKQEKDLEAALAEARSACQEMRRYQAANAAHAAKEAKMKKQMVELVSQNSKLTHRAELLNAANAQLVDKNKTMVALKAENAKLKQFVADYTNSMSSLQTSIQKVEDSANKLDIGALLQPKEEQGGSDADVNTGWPRGLKRPARASKTAGNRRVAKRFRRGTATDSARKSGPSDEASSDSWFESDES